jgi:hypothetical protein
VQRAPTPRPGLQLDLSPQEDPCEGQALPARPAECPSDYAQLCGKACSSEGAECGNEIGDGMQCASGTWQCSAHPPLGQGCNLVCRELPGQALVVASTQTRVPPWGTRVLTFCERRNRNRLASKRYPPTKIRTLTFVKSLAQCLRESAHTRSRVRLALLRNRDRRCRRWCQCRLLPSLSLRRGARRNRRRRCERPRPDSRSSGGPRLYSRPRRATPLHPRATRHFRATRQPT